MIRVRKAGERGHFNHGWLDTYHSFSFAGYFDEEHMGFRSLRVLNDDIVAPGRGFGTHGHSDMEILTYVLEGALEHKDSMGTGSVLHPGDVQRMTAGRGVRHSEFNHSKEEPLRLLQIWILPGEPGLTPGYEEKTFSTEEKRGKLRLIASPDGRDDSLTIHQDASVYASILAPGVTADHSFEPGRHGWIQVARGRMKLNGIELGRGDGVAVSDENEIHMEGVEEAEFLLFDLA
jgi:redox-sensitive bicupin YhaK (pirin superfamily)